MLGGGVRWSGATGVVLNYKLVLWRFIGIAFLYRLATLNSKNSIGSSSSIFDQKWIVCVGGE